MRAVSFTLPRLSQTDFATYGQLVDEEQNIVCVTLELPWLNNHEDTSCIPAGTYVAHRRAANETRHGYDVFELTSVPGRKNVQLHIGNLPHDSLGCILLGSDLGTVNGQPGITGSAAAFRRFMSSMDGINTFTLTITDPPLITN